MFQLSLEEREYFWTQMDAKLHKLWSDLEYDLWNYFKSDSHSIADDPEAPIVEELFKSAVKMQEITKKRSEKAFEARWTEFERELERKENDALEFQLDGCLMSFDELEYEEAI